MIRTVYAEHDDMTFIISEGNYKVEVVGFYFGEPDDNATRTYTGSLVAELVSESEVLD